MAKKNATAAAPAAPEKPKKGAKTAAAPAAEKPSQPTANGVTRPKPGTKTGRVWDIADQISAKKKAPAERGEVLEVAQKEGIPDATVATQFQRWRVFFAVPKKAAEPKPPKAEKAPKEPKAPKAK